MRGSPPFQLALLLLGFFALAVPLVQLTSGRPAPVTPKPMVTPGADTSRPVLIRLRYVNAPKPLSVKLGDKELLTQPVAGASTMEAHTAFVIPEEGIELRLHAEWPVGTADMPLTLEVEPDAMRLQSQTLWSIDNRIDDTLAFAWKP